ncbi:hypothetical protein GCU56_16820 [Geodermatophilus sabuli]|uniref:Tissue inhibitor of metalloproteinase n=1 Tax=Geodermatophilus sabuli TaxID=1564158 RepID=A0A7K3W407_9ACTN|nr:hypothetical protein [Geodermatophilus sabuli]NEK59522.1 hypothetical protein [Geodermatophilus sabuli]
MRRTTTCLLAACVLLLAGWVWAPAASACSCVGGTTAEHVERADVVFSGRLLSREVAGGSSSSDPALHVFAVETVWKGTAASEQGVVSAASGASCGLELDGDGPFLVFATTAPDLPTGQLAAGLCGGTARLAADLTSEVAAATGRGPEEPGPGAVGTDLVGGPSGWAVWVGAVVATLTVAALAVTGELRRRRAPGCAHRAPGYRR